MPINFQKIEKKWQQAWEKARLGEAKIDKQKKKFFNIFAYVTVSGFLHTGHMRGYSFSDTISLAGMPPETEQSQRHRK